MTLLVHTAVGTLLGRLLYTHPILAFVVSFISHFFVDMIPHGDSHVYARFKRKEKVKRAVAIVALDACATIFFILFIFNTQIFVSRLSVSLAIAAGILPDFLVALTEIYKPKWLMKYHGFHFYMHNLLVHKYHFDWPQWAGLTFQSIIFGFMMT